MPLINISCSAAIMVCWASGVVVVVSRSSSFIRSLTLGSGRAASLAKAEILSQIWKRAMFRPWTLLKPVANVMTLMLMYLRNLRVMKQRIRQRDGDFMVFTFFDCRPLACGEGEGI